MSRLIASFYNLFMFHTEQRCLSRWRTSLLAEASGKMLEIGAGTGLTIPCYPRTVNHLTLTEPDPHMRKLLQKAAANQAIPTEIVASTGEALDLPSSHFDAILFSLVLCSVADPLQVLSEAHRLLKPSGRLYFLEHIAAPDNSSRLLWQQRLEPIWKPLAGNCHLTRRTEQNIIDSGFSILHIVHQDMLPAPFFVRPTIRGVAIKRC
jgi:ubiquinone/menaquinone biosynthesis C-methylase UbiE